MCASFEFKGKFFRPGKKVRAFSAAGATDRVWSGFARSEIIAWWMRRGSALAELHATRFAERSDRTGKLVWADVPDGFVIRALIDPSGSRPSLKVLTRPANPEESRLFEHPRMPVLARPERPFEGDVLPPSDPDLFSAGSP